MKTLIVVDSQFGNTKKIAEEIAAFLLAHTETKLVQAQEANAIDINSINLLVVGSPTQGGRPTKTTAEFIGKIPNGSLKNVCVAAFDTRFEEGKQNFGLKLLMKVIGYAAPKISDSLNKKGGKEVMPPEGFIVTDKEGPLKEGELERSRDWAQKLLNACK